MASADISEAPEQHISIRPPRRWPGPGLAQLAEYRELVYFLAKRELQIKYKQSVFGVGWAVMLPVAIAFIFSLFLGKVAGVGSEGFPYAVFVLVALVPWLYTSQAIGLAANSLVGDSNLVSKVYFPRLALPIAKVLGLMVDLAISLIVSLVVVIIFGVAISSTAPLALLFLVLAVVAAFGLGTLFAAINVRYRDVSLVVPIMLQILFFATPIVYAGSLVTGPLTYVWALNPLTAVINGMRWSLLGAPAPDLLMVAISVASALTVVVVAIVYFRRTEQFFADVI